MSQGFFIAGTIPFIVLGLVHGIYTWIERSRPFRLTPRDVEVLDAMKGTALKIHPTTNLWRAWLGFNFSHSLGAVVFGLVYLVLATSNFAVIVEDLVLLWLPAVVSGLFVLLAWRYWFIIPLVGTGFGFGCFVVGAGLTF